MEKEERHEEKKEKTIKENENAINHSTLACFHHSSNRHVYRLDEYEIP